jgi:eukaryotic-like serine/threonine-protein kinase
MTMLDIDNALRSRRRRGPRGPGVGERLGDFRIVGLLGRGASARVYAAHDLEGREVALKVVHAPGNLTQVMRLSLEAELLARLRHPGVLRVEGTLGASGPWRFLALASLHGPTLRDAQGPWPVARLLPIARKLAEALRAVHAEMVVHCDLKPENVVLVTEPDGSEQPVLIDFDAARWLDRDTGRRAAVLPADTVYGTPAYMAPEQAAGDDVEASADVYAFGAILYEMMTGKAPVPGLWRRWRRRRVLFAAGYPDSLCDMVLDCLSELPRQRPSVASIVDELSPAMDLFVA